MKLQTKLALFNLLSKLVFSALFIGFLPLLIERINTLQTDRELIDKREQVIKLISEIGLDPFITSETETGFGSYNILKEEFISMERADLDEDWNFIEVATRIVDEETIDYRVLNYSIKIDGQTYLLEIGKSLSSIRYAAKNIRTVILLFLAFFIAVTLITDLTYTARVLRPLRIITRRLGTTSSPSFSDFSPVVTTTKDFRQLDQTLRDLMARIEELFRKEKEITVNISHELMTPVSVLRSKLENMLLKKDLDPEIETGIDESLRTLHRLKTLINSLLMIARLESRQYLKEDDVNLEELVTEVTGELSPIAADAGVRITSTCTGSCFFGKANRALLFSMFYNVVNNAIKHTPPEGSIQICGERRGEKFYLFITDTGRGMTEKQLEIIFSRFRTKLDPEIDSTGIGLAITKSIADFHAIEIKVTSEPGKGTEFCFIFP
ncbi:MAG: HAMP domain-containing histidine kinase [Bacteroidales bacterium]|nr:HAMP domain-containing histidine kinase [Bacteroidales bacterium]